MKRRAFLGFLGGAAVAGPSVAKTAAEMATTDLSLGKIGVSAISGGGFGSPAEWLMGRTYRNGNLSSTVKLPKW